MLILGGIACTDCELAEEKGSLGLLYELSEDGEGYVVAGMGECTDLDIEIPQKHEGLPVIGIQKGAFKKYDRITSVKMGNNVKFIQANAFEACKGLQSVTLSESLESVDETAFSGCTALQYTQHEHGYYLRSKSNAYFLLTSVEEDYYQYQLHEETVVIADKVFSNNDVIKGVDLGQSLKFIGESAFIGCYNLESVTFPKTLNKIGENAFASCDKITEITLPDGLVSLGKGAFCWNDSLTTVTVTGQTIGVNSFYHCENLTDVTIKNTVKEIEAGVFEGCKSLVSITIPDSVVLIDINAFARCPNLLNVSIGNGIQKMGLGVFDESDNVAFNQTKEGYFLGNMDNPWVVFMGFKDVNQESYTFPNDTRVIYEVKITEFSIQNITFGNHIKSFSDFAFFNCEDFENVYYTGTIEDWCGYEFLIESSNPMLYANNFYLNGELLTEITIPNTVSEIKSFAFYNLKTLTKLTVGDNVKTVGRRAFFGCNNLEQLNLGDGVEKIEEYAFGNCYALKELVIPNNVLIIEQGAFNNCNLRELTLPFFGESREATNEKGVLGYIFDGIISDNDDEDKYTCQFEKGGGREKKYYHYKIPNSLDKITFTGEIVKENALNNCAMVLEVVLDENVTEIQDRAFFFCISLKDLTIGSKVETIGKNAFSEKEYSNDFSFSIENVYYTGTATQWAQIEFANLSANPIWNAKNFYVQNKQMTEVVIEEGATKISENAFYGRSEIEKVEIADSVTYIGEKAFYGVDPISLKMPFTFSFNEKESERRADAIKPIFGKNIQNTLKFLHITQGVIKNGDIQWYRELEELVLGDGAITVEDSAINSCKNLTKLTITSKTLFLESSSIYFSSENPVEIYYTGTVADWCNVTNGKNNLFSKVESFYIDGELITDLIIPDTVTYISENAFAGYKKLTSVTIGAKVTEIGHDAFANCDNITTITFQGTVAQWKAVRKGYNWYERTCSAEKVYCQNGEVDIDE